MSFISTVDCLLLEGIGFSNYIPKTQPRHKVSGKLKVTNVDSSRKAIADLITKYRKAGGTVIHAMHKTPEGAPIFTPGTELAEQFEGSKAQASLIS